MEVIRCTDESWQECVLTVLRKADLVIIDNVDTSENIDWEIQQSSEQVGAERVLMLMREGAVAPTGVTALQFDFDGAQEEIDSVNFTWGEDDFGEPITLSDSGMQLAEKLRIKIKECGES